MESALGVVTGDVGAGKTVALRAAVAGLDPTRHQVIYIANPAFGARGLYVTIVRALGDRPRYLKAELMAQASDLLAAEAAERHRRVVIICDEAHLLQPDQLEELRLLTNAEMDSRRPFAGILAGQPTLNRQLRLGMFAALDQRIATRFTIKPMDLAESAAYLKPSPGAGRPRRAAVRRRRHRPAAPGRQRAAPRPEQRRRRRAHRRRRRRQGPHRRCLRKESSRRAHPRLAPLPGGPAAIDTRPCRPGPPARRPGRAPPRHRRVPRPARRRPASPRRRAATRNHRRARRPSSAHPDPTPARTPAPRPRARHHQDLPKREHRTLPNHAQIAWPLTRGPPMTRTSHVAGVLIVPSKLLLAQLRSTEDRLVS